ncbi:hypothetical protein IAD21_02064 [Abditibacteriota bacterium]|nr:hypothetical protein IAD21_02064 [Abditibacteriota bacterium]
MQSEFSPPSTQLDAVLWFLRVQMWLSVVYLVSGFVSPYGYGGFMGLLSLQNLIISGIPILILWLFPRPLAFASMGARARDPLVLRHLLGRCIGLSLFVRSLGNAVLLSIGLAEAFFSRGSFSLGGGYVSPFYFSSLIGTVVSFFLGFALAFGPAIRDNFRSR